MNIGVIPARLNSTRLPGKILLPIDGVPMVVRVYHKVEKAKKIDKIIVAVDNLKTLEILKKYGIEGCMTDIKHKSGTDRIAEAVKNIDCNFIVNIQGDEPEIEPDLIDDIIYTIKNENSMLTTAATTDLTSNDLYNNNVVKVKVNNLNHAIEFSRKLLMGEKIFRHIGIYAYNKLFLEKFTKSIFFSFRFLLILLLADQTH